MPTSMETRQGDSGLAFVGHFLLCFRYASRVATLAQDTNPRSFRRYASVARRTLCVLREFTVSSLFALPIDALSSRWNWTPNQHERCAVIMLDPIDLIFRFPSWIIATNGNEVRRQSTHASNHQLVECEHVDRDRTMRSTGAGSARRVRFAHQYQLPAR